MVTYERFVFFFDLLRPDDGNSPYASYDDIPPSSADTSRSKLGRLLTDFLATSVFIYSDFYFGWCCLDYCYGIDSLIGFDVRGSFVIYPRFFLRAKYCSFRVFVGSSTLVCLFIF